MSYWMLFKHSPESASDTPHGVNVGREDVNALCVFSSTGAAATAKDAVGPDYYIEEVAPDDVVSLAAIHGVDVVALDAYQEKPATLIRTVDAVDALTKLQ